MLPATGSTITPAMVLPFSSNSFLTCETSLKSRTRVCAAVSAGIWGWFDDDFAFTRDWGFALSEIAVPVALWQGGEDRMVPFAHGEWLSAHVAGVRAHLTDGDGHLSLAVSSLPKILDDLLEHATR